MFMSSTWRQWRVREGQPPVTKRWTTNYKTSNHFRHFALMKVLQYLYLYDELEIMKLKEKLKHWHLTHKHTPVIKVCVCVRAADFIRHSRDSKGKKHRSLQLFFLSATCHLNLISHCWSHQLIHDLWHCHMSSISAYFNFHPCRRVSSVFYEST